MEEMEGAVDGGSGGLVASELAHIRELVRQLEAHLGASPSLDLCRRLAAQIFSLTERSIARIASSDLAAAAVGSSKVAGVPLRTTRKRKRTEARKHQVRVGSSGPGGDCPADDGHSWRKYGQKEILGAKHPRGYYRCTHRHSQGCQATKQVQRTDEDATLVDVLYHGTHTCVQAAAAERPERSPDAHGLLQSLTAKKTEAPTDAAAEPEGWGADTLSSFCFSWTPESCDVSPATSESSQFVVFAPLDAAAAGSTEWQAQPPLQESAWTSTPAPPADVADEFLDVDIFFA